MLQSGLVTKVNLLIPQRCAHCLARRRICFFKARLCEALSKSRAQVAALPGTKRGGLRSAARPAGAFTIRSPAPPQARMCPTILERVHAHTSTRTFIPVARGCRGWPQALCVFGSFLGGRPPARGGRPARIARTARSASREAWLPGIMRLTHRHAQADRTSKRLSNALVRAQKVLKE